MERVFFFLHRRLISVGHGGVDAEPQRRVESITLRSDRRGRREPLAFLFVSSALGSGRLDPIPGYRCARGDETHARNIILTDEIIRKRVVCIYNSSVTRVEKKTALNERRV